MAKHGKLSSIKVREMSMVDLPANKSPFLFFKREGEGQRQLTKAKKKIKIEIESDGLVGGTTVAVNGDKLGQLKSFDFSFYGNDPKQTVHASYSKETSSTDGFSRIETYYLSKGVIAMTKEMLKTLQEYLGTEDIDFEKRVDEEEIQKALELITKHYKDSFPEDLENAVGILAKCSSGGYDVKEKGDLEKAGAKFSKDVLRKLQAVIAAVKALESIVDSGKQSTEKVADGSEEMADLTKQVTELSEAITKLSKPSENKSDSKTEEATKLSKELKAISERVKKMEQDGVTKGAIDGQENTDGTVRKGAGENGKVLWPSLDVLNEGDDD